jgi:hypothetical protein
LKLFCPLLFDGGLTGGGKPGMFDGCGLAGVFFGGM